MKSKNCDRVNRHRLGHLAYWERFFEAMLLNKLGRGFWPKAWPGKTRVLKKLSAPSSIVDRLRFLDRSVSGVRLDATTLATLRGVARINSLEAGVARSCMNLFIAECHELCPSAGDTAQAVGDRQAHAIRWTALCVVCQ